MAADFGRLALAEMKIGGAGFDQDFEVGVDVSHGEKSAEVLAANDLAHDGFVFRPVEGLLLRK